MSVRGAGAATLKDVHYDKAYNNRWMQKNILVKHLAPIFYADFRQPRAECIVEAVGEEDFEWEEESLSVDYALMNILLRNVKEPKGFRRHNLAILILISWGKRKANSPWGSII